jgi:hypothetical protein
MANELAGTLQQADRIRQRCAVKEPTFTREVNTLTYPKGASPRHYHRNRHSRSRLRIFASLKPLMRDCSQFTSMLFHPRIDGGMAFDNTVESQQLLSSSLHFRFRIRLRGTPTRGTKGIGPDNRAPVHPITLRFRNHLSLEFEFASAGYAGTTVSNRASVHVQ